LPPFSNGRLGLLTRLPGGGMTHATETRRSALSHPQLPVPSVDARSLASGGRAQGGRASTRRADPVDRAAGVRRSAPAPAPEASTTSVTSSHRTLFEVIQGKGGSKSSQSAREYRRGGKIFRLIVESISEVRR